VTSVVFLAIGVALLYAGGEVLVASASNLARACGLGPLVIGLTVVAFATSTPELFATLVGVLRGAPDLGMGNVLGSNIANLGLILGLSALVRPLVGRGQFLKREVPLLIAVAAVPFWVLRDGRIDRLEGAVLFVLLLGYVVWLLRGGEPPEVVAEYRARFAGPPWPGWRSAVGLAVGLALLLGGAHLLVDGAVAVARALGISGRVIGLTVVAVGTSLPELASSLVAARRQEGDIVLGNIVGSNIFNVLCVLGLTAVVRPIAVDPSSVTLDVWVGLGLSVSLLPLLLLGRRMHLSRWEGALLLAAYAAYLWVLFR
jgi:cation:H+ antiporter